MTMSRMEMCEVTCSEWSKDFLKELYTLQQEKLMCNVRLMLNGGGEIAAHSSVLAAASPFLRTLLPENHACAKIDMATIPQEIARQVLHFIYTGKVMIHRRDLTGLRNVASMLKISALLDILRTYQVDSENIHHDETDIVSDVNEQLSEQHKLNSVETVTKSAVVTSKEQESERDSLHFITHHSKQVQPESDHGDVTNEMSNDITDNIQHVTNMEQPSVPGEIMDIKQGEIPLNNGQSVEMQQLLIPEGSPHGPQQLTNLTQFEDIQHKNLVPQDIQHTMDMARSSNVMHSSIIGLQIDIQNPSNDMHNYPNDTQHSCKDPHKSTDPHKPPNPHASNDLLHPSSEPQQPAVPLHPSSDPLQPSNLLHPSSHLQQPSDPLHPSSHLQQPSDPLHPSSDPQQPSNLLHPSSDIQQPSNLLHPSSDPQQPSVPLHPSSDPQQPSVPLHPSSDIQQPSNLLHPSSDIQQPSKDIKHPTKVVTDNINTCYNEQTEETTLIVSFDSKLSRSTPGSRCQKKVGCLNRICKISDKVVSSNGFVHDRAERTLPDDLVIHGSSQVPAGRGVFTMVSLPKGCMFGPYKGEIITGLEGNRQSKYCWAIYKNCKLLHWIDGCDESTANWLRFVQHAKTDYNLEALQHNGELFFRLLRSIKPDTELIVGSHYKTNYDELFMKLGDGASLPLWEAGSPLTDSLTISEAECLWYFACNTCSIIFNSQKLYYSHIQEIHGQLTPLNMYINTDDEIESDSKEVLDAKSDALSPGDQPNVHLPDSPVQLDESVDAVDVYGTDFKCPECNEIFVVEMLYYKHMQAIHGKPLPLEIYLTKQKTGQAKILSAGAQKTKYKHSVSDKMASSKLQKTEHSSGHSGDELFTCTVCKKSFVHESGLEKHKCGHTVMKTHQCTHCVKRFTLKCHLVRHMVTHVNPPLQSTSLNDNGEHSNFEGTNCVGLSDVNTDGSESVKQMKHATLCPICGKNLCRKDYLAQHMMIHSGERPYKCPDCGKGFTHIASLRVHKRVHTGERPYSCTVCSRSFTYASIFEAHKASHTGHRPHKCTICEKAFGVKQRLTVHLKTHDKDEQNKCNVCNNTFPCWQELKLHKESAGCCTVSVSCSTCGKSFSSKSSLRQHEKQHREKLFKCDRCEYTTMHKPQLRTHRLTHEGGKPHTCDTCHKSFTRKGSLVAHVRTLHKSTEQYACPTCDKIFSRASDRRRHELLHVGTKSFHCKICDKSFGTRGILKAHLLTHSGEMPFKCILCEKTYRQKVDLTAHMHVHNGEKPFKCDTCPKAFPYRKSLRCHIKIHKNR